MHRCLSCMRARQSLTLSAFCQSCLGELVEPEGEFLKGTSLFRYEGNLRTLILEAKAGRNWVVAKRLSEAFAMSEKAEQACRGARAIIPAPSSAWSRIRGKTDLAYELSSALCKRYDLPHRSPPQSLGWSFHKQSAQTDRQGLLQRGSPQAASSWLLLVDDVVTSGSTLLNLAHQLPGNSSWRFLTLADATSATLKDSL